ncbi:MAG TPA: prenyltransferase [Planctomycetaceae bacterium]|nr:prenyltransferase [Planctomycetaceae bacterium]
MGRTSRRAWLRSVAGGSAAMMGAPLWAQMGTSSGRGGLPAVITPEIDRAIRAGLDYLLDRQTEDGALGARGYRRNVAVVSLAGMAFLARGSTPGRGEYGAGVDRATRYILAHCQDNGFIVAEEAQSHGPMYGHGFATLFLAEVYGMWPDSEIREKLAAAVRLIVQTQNPAGGWRYLPEPTEADISVTICQMMALRAARNAGIYVPNETVDRCLQYVKSCQNPDGGFGYTPHTRPSLYPRSAAAVVALYSAGVYDSPEVEKALAYLEPFHRQLPRLRHESNFLYGQYYAAQAMWHAGGEPFRRWYRAASETLLEAQRADGSWDDEICPEYGTAMACLVLQTPSNYLPIFQR